MNYTIFDYCYDDKFTDMADAWYHIIQYYNSETDSICEYDARGHDKPAGEFFKEFYVPIEIETAIKKCIEKQLSDEVEYNKTKFIKELNEYNAKLMPQEKGQIVRIVSGKNKGIVGKVSWLGTDKFKHIYDWSRYHSTMSQYGAALYGICKDRPYVLPNEDAELVLIRPINDVFENGKDKMYVKKELLEVIEGYNNINVSDDAIISFVRRHSSYGNKLRGVYNCEFHLKDNELENLFF